LVPASYLSAVWMVVKVALSLLPAPVMSGVMRAAIPGSDEAVFDCGCGALAVDESDDFAHGKADKTLHKI
jgi:hypothetical protein